MTDITYEILYERMMKIHASLKHKQDNDLIPAEQALKAQIMDLTLSDFLSDKVQADLKVADSKAIAKYWRNNSPMARELGLDVPSQGQPTKDYGQPMRDYETRVANMATTIENSLSEEERAILERAAKSPSKNDTYDTVKAAIKHLISDKLVNRLKNGHHDKGLTFDENGLPVLNLEIKEEA
tara:strand:+ start:644 stop:1189 length:546 start_codon:yes stop_codon:yes gene_type:complete